MSCCYLLHFHAPIAPGRHTCQHYLGSCDDLEQRLRQHRYCPDARLLQVAKLRGIGFDVVRVWWATAGDARKLERQLKQLKSGPMLCPVCRSERNRERWQLPLWGPLDFSLNDVEELAW